MSRAWQLLFLISGLLTLTASGMAQTTGAGGTGGSTGGSTSGSSGSTQSAAAANGGIKIDAQGIMSLVVPDNRPVPFDKKRRTATARQSQSSDSRIRSPMRFVSLVKLEEQLNHLVTAGEPLPDELFYLAGLERIEYLLVVPEEHDVVIAGPADAFVPDATGRMLSVENGRPTLRLDDLIVALRTAATSQQWGCSIDPDPERLLALRKFIRNAPPASEQEVEARFHEMDDILGLNNVRIDAVPPDSHFATALVEADYRMKLIASGLEDPHVKGLKSHLALMNARGNMMQRWWFVPHYTALFRAEDGLSFQFVGARARLMTEEEYVDDQGHRKAATTTRASNLTFAKLFSDRFSQLADQSPVFGELQNLMDWSVLAALLSTEKIPSQVEWTPGVFYDTSRWPHPIYATPRKVESTVSYKRSGNSLVGLVSGGVVIRPSRTCVEFTRLATPTATDDSLKTAQESLRRTEHAKTHLWWWD